MGIPEIFMLLYMSSAAHASMIIFTESVESRGHICGKRRLPLPITTGYDWTTALQRLSENY